MTATGIFLICLMGRSFAKGPFSVIGFLELWPWGVYFLPLWQSKGRLSWSWHDEIPDTDFIKAMPQVLATESLATQSYGEGFREYPLVISSMADWKTPNLLTSFPLKCLCIRNLPARHVWLPEVKIATVIKLITGSAQLQRKKSATKLCTKLQPRNLRSTAVA